MRCRRFIQALFLLFFVSITLVSENAEARSYLLAYISDSANASPAYWVAKEKGIFKKYGLDIDLIYISGSTRGIQSLIAGDVAFVGGVGTSAIYGKLAGGDIAIVDSLTNTLPYYIIGKPEIKSPEDIKGRSAAIHIPGTAADFALRLALKQLKLTLKDIKAVTVGTGTARVLAVSTGQLDFTVGQEAERLKGEQGGLKVILDMARLKIPFQLTCTVTSRKLIRDNPNVVQRLVKAMAETLHYYKNNKEEVIKVLQKYTRGQDRTVLEKSYVAYHDLLVDDTYPTVAGLRNILDIQAEIDPNAAKAKPEDVLDLRFVDELKTSGFLADLAGKK
jgi:ABC-type nitrate/sulfonate/bicarbonate transport system substrate-binding protein